MIHGEAPQQAERAERPVGRRVRGRRAMHGTTWAAALVVLLGSGCDGTSGAGNAPVAASGPDAPRAAPAGTVTAVVNPVHWPPPTAIDRSARAALSGKARQAVDRSPVPVLVPAITTWQRAPKVMTGEHWFAFSGVLEGVTMAVHGNRLAKRYPGIEPARGNRRVRGRPAFVGSDRRIWSASWVEEGVAYSLDVECTAADDPRCADERYVLEQADALRYVGGRGSDATGSGGGS